MMKFYNQQHQLYCGIDLHSKTMHACVVDDRREKLLHRNFQCRQPERFFDSLGRLDAKDIIVGCESTFNWYWLADECHGRGLAFILGHALYLKAIHGGKTNSDPIDSENSLASSAAATFRCRTFIPK